MVFSVYLFFYENSSDRGQFLFTFHYEVYDSEILRGRTINNFVTENKDSYSVVIPAN